MHNMISFNGTINTNTPGAIGPIFMVGGKRHLCITIVPDNAAHTTFVLNSRYRLNDADTWHDFSTLSQLSAGTPQSVRLDVGGIPQVTVQVTTVQGSDGHAEVYGFAEGNID